MPVTWLIGTGFSQTPTWHLPRRPLRHGGSVLGHLFQILTAPQLALCVNPPIFGQGSHVCSSWPSPSQLSPGSLHPNFLQGCSQTLRSQHTEPSRTPAHPSLPQVRTRAGTAGKHGLWVWLPGCFWHLNQCSEEGRAALGVGGHRPVSRGPMQNKEADFILFPLGLGLCSQPWMSEPQVLQHPDSETCSSSPQVLRPQPRPEGYESAPLHSLGQATNSPRVSCLWWEGHRGASQSPGPQEPTPVPDPLLWTCISICEHFSLYRYP